MDKQVAVIIPVWNGEAKIEASVRSVLSQSWQNLRLLVVDDGSTDGTAGILRRLSQEDPRLQYAVEYALQSAQGAELVIFGYAILRPDGSARAYCEPEQALTRETLGENLSRLYKANLLNQVWGKLYAAPLLAGLSFPDYRWGEDRLFLFDALERAERIRILPECKYHYIMQEGESLITRYYEKKFRVCCEIDARLEALCAKLGAAGDADFRYMFAKSVFSCLTNLFSRSCRLGRAEKRNVVRQIVNDPRVHRRCRDASGGLPTRLLCAVLRSRSVGLNLLCFRSFRAPVSPS